MKTAQRIGIFGGLFDPPHIGHLIIAQLIRENFKLNSILFVPAGNPPHKHTYSSYRVRYHLTGLAIQSNKKFCISDIESKITGKTYTIEVIKMLRNKVSGALYLMIGADQWEELDTWKTPQELIELCKIIVLPRPGYRIRHTSLKKNKVIVSQTPLIDISSTIIRKRVKKGLDVRYYVTPEVNSCIKRKKLYR